MLRLPVQKMSFFQLMLLGCWVFGVALRGVVDAIIENVYGWLVKSLSRAEGDPGIEVVGCGDHTRWTRDHSEQAIGEVPYDSLGGLVHQKNWEPVSARSKKVYVVRKGYRTGLYFSWPEIS